MPVKVVDVSAIAALLFGEPQAVEIASRLQNAQLAAPSLLAFEVASVCLKKLRLHPEQRDALVATHGLLERISISETKVELTEVVPLAERMRLTVYDASYLWLAHKLQADLVTLDGELAEATRRIS